MSSYKNNQQKATHFVTQGNQAFLGWIIAPPRGNPAQVCLQIEYCFKDGDPPILFYPPIGRSQIWPFANEPQPISELPEQFRAMLPPDPPPQPAPEPVPQSLPAPEHHGRPPQLPNKSWQPGHNKAWPPNKPPQPSEPGPAQSGQPQPDQPQPAPPPPPPPESDSVSEFRSRLLQLKNKPFQPGQHKSQQGGRPPQPTPQPDQPQPKEGDLIRRAPYDPEYPYTKIRNSLIQDSRLSIIARGIHIYLLSKPDDWLLIVKDIARECKLSKKKVYVALQELRALRYLLYWAEKDEEGRLIKNGYYIHETPAPDDKPDEPLCLYGKVEYRPKTKTYRYLIEPSQSVEYKESEPRSRIGKAELLAPLSHIGKAAHKSKAKTRREPSQSTENKESEPHSHIGKAELLAPLSQKPQRGNPQRGNPHSGKRAHIQIKEVQITDSQTTDKQTTESSSSGHDYHVAAGKAVMMMMEKFGFSQKEAEDFAGQYPLEQITNALARWDEIDQSQIEDRAGYGAILIRKGSKPVSTNRQLRQSSPSETPEETKARLQTEEEEYDKEKEMKRSALEHFNALPVDTQEEMFQEFKKYMVKKHSNTANWTREEMNGPFEADLFRRFDGETFTERREE
jgi:hypothetical protein